MSDVKIEATVIEPPRSALDRAQTTDPEVLSAAQYVLHRRVQQYLEIEQEQLNLEQKLLEKRREVLDGFLNLLHGIELRMSSPKTDDQEHQQQS